MERINRIVTSMLSKEADKDTTSNYWYLSLEKIKFALNNTGNTNRSTGHSPSMLFGSVLVEKANCAIELEKTY